MLTKSDNKKTLKDLVEEHTQDDWETVVAMMLGGISELDQLDVEGWHMDGMVPAKYHETVLAVIGMQAGQVDLCALEPAGMTQKQRDERDAAWVSYVPEEEPDDIDEDNGRWEEKETEGEGMSDAEDADLEGDSESEQDSEPEPEEESDSGVEGGIDEEIEMVAEPEPESDTEPEPESDTEPEPEVYPESETEPEPEVELEPEPEPDMQEWDEADNIADGEPEPQLEQHAETAGDSELLEKNIEKIVAITTGYLSSDDQLKALLRHTAKMPDEKTPLGKIVYALLMENAHVYVAAAEGITNHHAMSDIKLGIWVGRCSRTTLGHIAFLLESLLAMQNQRFVAEVGENQHDQIERTLRDLGKDDYDLIAQLADLDFTGQNLV